MLFNCRNADLYLSFITSTSSSGPPRSPMMLSRYVNNFTSSRVSLSSVIELVLSNKPSLEHVSREYTHV